MTERLNASYGQVRLALLLDRLPLGAALLTTGLVLAGLLLRVAALGVVATAELLARAAAAAGAYLPGVTFALAMSAVCTGLVLALRAAALGAVWLLRSTDAALANVTVQSWSTGGRS